jgi:biopolymer transport protein ExbB/TolQ
LASVKIKSLVQECLFCKWIKSSSWGEKKQVVKQVSSTPWFKLQRKTLLWCLGISTIVALFSSLSQAGCSLVAMAIMLEATDRFNESFKQGIQASLQSQKSLRDRVVQAKYKAQQAVRKSKNQNAKVQATRKINEIESKISEMDKLFSDSDQLLDQATDAIRKRSLHVVALLIGLIGTILWGFASPNWPCILTTFCYS